MMKNLAFGPGSCGCFAVAAALQAVAYEETGQNGLIVAGAGTVGAAWAWWMVGEGRRTVRDWRKERKGRKGKGKGKEEQLPMRRDLDGLFLEEGGSLDGFGVWDGKLLYMD